MTTYSQFGIERYLDELFDGPGFFLELGAWDGYNLSNSAYLESKGWQGLCVDPFPQHFEGRRATVCRWAVSAQGGYREFVKVTRDRRDGGDVSYFSGFRDTIGRHWETIRKFCDYEIIKMETVTIDDLFRYYGLSDLIDFLSIDTEGSELEIIRSIDFNRYRFRAILFEHNQNEEIRQSVRGVLESNGYIRYMAMDFDDLYIFDYKAWLDREYQEWVQALQESTVDNFKENRMVRRMLGEVDSAMYTLLVDPPGSIMYVIDSIGRSGVGSYISGAGLRMIYYAGKVLQRRLRPRAIVEIGGGVGQFYATLRALGYEGKYMILDLPGVQKFQRDYLDECTKRTGLELTLSPDSKFDFCVSFYALGEFDDSLKKYYIDHIIKKCPHGLIVWNPHSGASSNISFDCEIEDERPTTHLSNKVLTW